MPAALPYIIAGMRLAIARVLIMVVVAELYASTAGIGYLIFQAGASYDTSMIFVGVVILATAGVLLNAFLRAIERRIAPWLGSHSMIEVRNVSHGFARGGHDGDVFPVLDDVSFTIKDGSIASLLGPSGCGKTTLLRIIDGLIRPLAGEIRIDGATVRKPATDRTMVFQEFNLLPWRTALRNIEFAGEMHGLPRGERRQRAETVLKRVGLDRFANYFPHQLSGGMKQRVGLARALSTNPKVLLMDEPFGALDPQIRELMQIELLKLLEAEGKTIVFVTHSDRGGDLPLRHAWSFSRPIRGASSRRSTSSCRGRAGRMTRRSRPVPSSCTIARRCGI